MAITHQISGIDFTNIKTSNYVSIAPFAGNRIYQSSSDELNEDFGVGGDLPTIINAVEIDWNGAELNLPDDLGGTKTINTTGELLKERIQQNSPMFARVA